MKTICCMGFSDDTFCLVSSEGDDISHDNCGTGAPIVFEISTVEHSLYVVGQYSPAGGGCWLIGVQMPDEGEFPPWETRFEPNHEYSPQLRLDVPQDARVRDVTSLIIDKEPDPCETTNTPNQKADFEDFDWLRAATASSSFTPEWQKVANALYDLTLKMLQEFAKQCSPTEEFCLFSLQCHADFGRVEIGLTTTEFVQQVCQEQRETYGDDLDDWRTDSSYLKYERINYLGSFRQTWEENWCEHEQFVAQSVKNDWEQNKEDDMSYRFLDVCCQVIVRLECDDAFQCLKRSRNFCTSLTDNDLTECAMTRLAIARASA